MVQKQTTRNPRRKANGEGTIYKQEKNGKIYYRGQLCIGYNANGTLKRKTFSGTKKSEVDKKMAEYKTKLHAGLLSANENYTLEQWFFDWLFEFRRNDLKASSFERYEGIYRNYVKNTQIGKKNLCDLRATHIQSYYNNLLQNGKTANTIRTINKHLKTCLNEAVRQNYLSKNHCTHVTLPKIQKQETKPVFTAHEQKEFMAALGGHRLRTLFILALGSGLRLGELLALKWCDISFENNTVAVTKSVKSVAIISKNGARKWVMLVQPPKTESSMRTIPIPVSVINELSSHRNRQLEEKSKYEDLYQNNELIFCTKLGLLLDQRNVTRAYKRILNKTSVPYKNFHSLRHTYATRLFEANVDIKTTQSLMGHSDITTTMNIYTHTMPEKLAEGVEKINDLFISC